MQLEGKLCKMVMHKELRTRLSIHTHPCLEPYVLAFAACDVLMQLPGGSTPAPGVSIIEVRLLSMPVCAWPEACVSSASSDSASGGVWLTFGRLMI